MIDEVVNRAFESRRITREFATFCNRAFYGLKLPTWNGTCCDACKDSSDGFKSMVCYYGGSGIMLFDVESGDYLNPSLESKRALYRDVYYVLYNVEDESMNGI